MTSPSTSSLSLPPPPPDNRFRILLLEDDTQFATQILSFLAKAGFDCRHATEMQMGMDAFNQVQPHLLLSEAKSAGMDGLTFCGWVRTGSGIPVMLMGPNQEAAEIAALKIGADDYISLPLRPATLMARIVAQLRRCYRYNVPPKMENPFGLPVEEEESTGSLPPGWASCELCGYQGPRSKFEKEDWLGNVKMICPNCKSSDHVVISID
ncbi:MAG: response regulator transcription factor [Cytophagaceae bacterium]|nr:MAG: response regulator transcription factor [Cytophagaceae bacterium]